MSNHTPNIPTVFLFHKMTITVKRSVGLVLLLLPPPPPLIIIALGRRHSCLPTRERVPWYNHADAAGGNSLQHHRVPPVPQFKMPFPHG